MSLSALETDDRLLAHLGRTIVLPPASALALALAAAAALAKC